MLNLLIIIVDRTSTFIAAFDINFNNTKTQYVIYMTKDENKDLNYNIPNQK